MVQARIGGDVPKAGSGVSQETPLPPEEVRGMLGPIGSQFRQRRPTGNEGRIDAQFRRTRIPPGLQREKPVALRLGGSAMAEPKRFGVFLWSQSMGTSDRFRNGVPAAT